MTKDWRNDPSADDRWNAGLDYGQRQLCAVLGVDPRAVSWDAATETLDGDVQSVICNILRARAGDDWQDVGKSSSPAPAAPVDEIDQGASPAGNGLSPSVEPLRVSPPDGASIPRADWWQRLRAHGPLSVEPDIRAEEIETQCVQSVVLAYDARGNNAIVHLPATMVHWLLERTAGLEEWAKEEQRGRHRAEDQRTELRSQIATLTACGATKGSERAAPGIEARSDATRSGAAEGESPMPEGQAPYPIPSPPVDEGEIGRLVEAYGTACVVFGMADRGPDLEKARERRRGARVDLNAARAARERRVAAKAFEAAWFHALCFAVEHGAKLPNHDEALRRFRTAYLALATSGDPCPATSAGEAREAETRWQVDRLTPEECRQIIATRTTSTGA